ncbi:hypothetical protein, partial [Salmonella sp. s51944]|uniref:hypothetical protein n=1 Tax=Salmonella sp. s51944 TaxID=3159655 RepID=UPI0039818643
MVIMWFLIILTVIFETHGQRLPNFCDDGACGCDPPQDLAKISWKYNEKYSFEEGCLCVCGALHYENCTTDGDCVNNYL